jgi:hypothetical protein
VFSRVTIGFGIALIAMSGLAAVTGATTTGTASVPAVIGGLLILFGWVDRRIAPARAGRLQSRSRFPVIGAAVLVLSSARGITLITDAPGPGATPSGTETFLLATVVAGVAYIVFGAGSDIAEMRRAARARAVAPPTATRASGPHASAPHDPAPHASARRGSGTLRRRTRR